MRDGQPIPPPPKAVSTQNEIPFAVNLPRGISDIAFKRLSCKQIQCLTRVARRCFPCTIDYFVMTDEGGLLKEALETTFKGRLLVQFFILVSLELKASLSYFRWMKWPLGHVGGFPILLYIGSILALSSFVFKKSLGAMPYNSTLCN